MALDNQILERIFHSSSQTPWGYKWSGGSLDTSDHDLNILHKRGITAKVMKPTLAKLF